MYNLAVHMYCLTEWLGKAAINNQCMYALLVYCCELKDQHGNISLTMQQLINVPVGLSFRTVTVNLWSFVKNSTNLVTHLRTFHKDAFKAYSQKKDDLCWIVYH